MLSLSVLTLMAGVSTCVVAVTINDDGYYDTRYNHLDIEKILNNKRLVTYYGKCLTGDGPCTPQGTEFKRILPEALRTNCIRCTDRQKRTAYLAIKRLKKEYPKIWQQLQAEWDPTGELVSTFINSVESNANAVQPTASEPTAAQFVTQPTSTDPRSTQPSTIKPSAIQPGANQIVVDGRFGSTDTDNEIQAAEAHTTAPLLPTPLPTITTTTTRRTTTTTAAAAAAATTAATAATAESTATTMKTSTGVPVYYSTRFIPPPPVLATEVNYRTSFRPTRFNILLPRPQDFGKITVNWIGSIGDIGSKVIRTGARIADMVLSGVQAGVHATIRRPL